MTGLRDYQEWHSHYDDPASSLSWRLRTVQAQLHAAMDARPGPVSVLSVCSGDGRDLIEVASAREDAHRLRATFVEIDPDVRRWFAAARFTELDYQTQEGEGRPALGVLRYDGEPQPLRPARLFTSLR